MTKTYDDNFYKSRNNKTYPAASIIVPIIFDLLEDIETVVDFGCGVGTWLKICKENGAKEILGLDGSWVNKQYLEIEQENFKEVNFENFIKLDKKYSLAISLEVAEHITEENSDNFIKSIANASDIVLFSAAIPGQDGTNHFNEQWQSYWVNKFKKENYNVIDIIRPIIWANEKIPFWYRQNIFLYANNNIIENLNINYCKNTIIDVVHPQLFYERHIESRSTKGSWKLFRRSIKKKLSTI